MISIRHGSFRSSSWFSLLVSDADQPHNSRPFNNVNITFPFLWAVVVRLSLSITGTVPLSSQMESRSEVLPLFPTGNYGYFRCGILQCKCELIILQPLSWRSSLLTDLCCFFTFRKGQCCIHTEIVSISQRSSGARTHSQLGFEKVKQRLG